MSDTPGTTDDEPFYDGPTRRAGTARDREVAATTAAAATVAAGNAEDSAARTQAGTADLAAEVRNLAGAIIDLDTSYRSEQATQLERLKLVEDGRRADRVAIRLITLAIVGVVALGGLLVYLVDELSDVAATNRANGQTLIACTVPLAEADAEEVARYDTPEDIARRCYERGQAGQAGAITAIVHCTRLPDGTPPEQVDACIVDELTP